MKDDTSETVEFAIKLQDVLLPVDSHWPVEKYKRLTMPIMLTIKKLKLRLRKDLAAAFRTKSKSSRFKIYKRHQKLQTLQYLCSNSFF